MIDRKRRFIVEGIAAAGIGTTAALGYTPKHDTVAQNPDPAGNIQTIEAPPTTTTDLIAWAGVYAMGITVIIGLVEIAVEQDNESRRRLSGQISVNSLQNGTHPTSNL